MKNFSWGHFFLCIGITLMVIAVVIGLIAIWTINTLTQNHLADTAGLLGVAGFLLTVGSTMVIVS